VTRDWYEPRYRLATPRPPPWEDGSKCTYVGPGAGRDVPGQCTDVSACQDATICCVPPGETTGFRPDRATCDAFRSP
jgi:hypothetical protein